MKLANPLAVLSQRAKQRDEYRAGPLNQSLNTTFPCFQSEPFTDRLRDFGDQRKRHAAGEWREHCVTTSKKVFARKLALRSRFVTGNPFADFRNGEQRLAIGEFSPIACGSRGMVVITHNGQAALRLKRLAAGPAELSSRFDTAL
jgi:hypothetical protein